MNATKTKILRKHIEELAAIFTSVELIKEDLEEIYDERSEKYKDSEKGESDYDEFMGLDHALEHIQMAIDEIEQILE